MNQLDEIKELDQRINDLRSIRAEKLAIIQSECRHNNILEVEYKSGNFFGAFPPFRVCVDCGLAEEGWHCGYYKLNTREEVPRISREKARRDYVLTFRTQEEINKERFHK